MSRTKSQRGSKVFRDLGFPPAEARNLLLRAQVLYAIKATARRLTREEAAQLFGVAQPRLRAALRGQVDKFSLDELVDMAARAGMRVELHIERAA